jgi:signal transduction histidine kinase
MTPLRSLRARVLLGAVLWTIGLLTVVTIVFTFSARARDSMMVVHLHTHLSAVVCIVTMLGGIVLLHRTLAPFDRIRARLSEVRAGKAHHLTDEYPSEIQPVVDDLNALLDHRDEAVRRALAKAGDLAHGLKTPLAVIAQEADRVRAAGHPELADTLAQEIERMRRQMDYHLAHARAAASGATPGARCSVSESAEGLARTLRRLYVQRGVTIDLRVPASHFARAGREDLDEMLGNLLDNACKWARTRVDVESIAQNGAVTIVVDDDGPGLDPSMRSAVLQRGVRADEAAPGSGFGLAIVRDLADLYGGSISLDSSPIGGLRAALQLRAS